MRAVLAHLSDYLRPLMTCCYLTSWRKAEVLGLKWSNVDFRAQDIRLEPGITKNDQPRTFPSSALRADGEGHPVGVSQHRPADPRLPRHVEEGARWAKLPGKMVHDFRRTAVRNLERAGVPRSVAMKLTGHLTESIYRRYAVVSPVDLNAGVEKLARLHDMLAGAKVGWCPRPLVDFGYLAAVSMPGRTWSARTHARTGGFSRSTHPFHTALCASNNRISASQT